MRDASFADSCYFYRTNFLKPRGSMRPEGREMQAAVQKLSQLGTFPSSANPDTAKLQEFQDILSSVKDPISDDDARALVQLFGSDDCFGLAWTLLHLIETAPNWPLEDCLRNTGNEWVNRLKERLPSLRR